MLIMSYACVLKVYLAKYKKEETLVAVKTVRLAASEDDKVIVVVSTRTTNIS